MKMELGVYYTQKGGQPEIEEWEIKEYDFAIFVIPKLSYWMPTICQPTDFCLIIGTWEQKKKHFNLIYI